ncbi:hypothetical protein PAXRUDRAFT_16817 [Paxillus rubicundulus Ve08.2h10]|uniref:Uncharacterized protein n=1 Tax=Paxillus rubicundulus Ve08.2h10 TaxID=930991 RepID=A0A0D0C5Y7_9AGAM|nr:hypothetical protein PAXRUDRAFT_16817 [Paxillus rubicundulus Ve08.2h10]
MSISKEAIDTLILALQLIDSASSSGHSLSEDKNFQELTSPASQIPAAAPWAPIAPIAPITLPGA